MNITISALLINHNSNGTILNAIRPLLEQDLPFDSILIVDNGSTDGGPQQIRETFPQVKVIELGEICGLSHARNLGLSQLNSDLVLLMDDDVYLSEGAVQKMVSALLASNAVVVCPRIVLYPETDVIQCDGAAVHFSGTLALRHAHDAVSLHTPGLVKADGFIGACLLVDRRRLMELGGFDQDYFFYFEDLELSYRLYALGYAMYCEENAVALHDRGEGTENLSYRGSGPYPTRRAYLNLHNRWLTILIHYQARTLILLLPALLFYEFTAFVVSMRRGWLGMYFKAVFSLLYRIPSIAGKRGYWQSRRKVKDRDILSGGDLPLSRGFVHGKEAAWLDRLNRILNLYWGWSQKWL